MWKQKHITVKQLETLNKRRAFFGENPYFVTIDGKIVSDDVAMRMVGRRPAKLKRRVSEFKRNNISIKRCRKLYE